jgi:hypothetical protein
LSLSLLLQVFLTSGGPSEKSLVELVSEGEGDKYLNFLKTTPQNNITTFPMKTVFQNMLKTKDEE